MAPGHQCGPGCLPRPHADRGLVGDAGSGQQATFLDAARRRHGAHEGVAVREVWRRGDQQVPLPPLSLLHPRHVVSGLRLWSVRLAHLRRRPSATLQELIATVEEYKDSLEEQEAKEHAEASCAGCRSASRLMEALLSTS